MPRQFEGEETMDDYAARHSKKHSLVDRAEQPADRAQAPEADVAVDPAERYGGAVAEVVALHRRHRAGPEGGRLAGTEVQLDEIGRLALVEDRIGHIWIERAEGRGQLSYLTGNLAIVPVLDDRQCAGSGWGRHHHPDRTGSFSVPTELSSSYIRSHAVSALWLAAHQHLQPAGGALRAAAGARRGGYGVSEPLALGRVPDPPRADDGRRSAGLGGRGASPRAPALPRRAAGPRRPHVRRGAQLQAPSGAKPGGASSLSGGAARRQWCSLRLGPAQDGRAHRLPLPTAALARGPDAANT